MRYISTTIALLGPEDHRAAMALLKTFEVGELADRLEAVEAVLTPRLPKPTPKPRRR